MLRDNEIVIDKSKSIKTFQALCKAMLMFLGLQSDEVYQDILLPDMPYDRPGSIYFHVKNDEDMLQNLIVGDTLVGVELLHTTCGTPNYIAPEVASFDLDKPIMSYEPNVETTSVRGESDSTVSSAMDRALKIQSTLKNDKMVLPMNF